MRYDRGQFPTVFTRESRHQHQHEYHETAASSQPADRQAEVTSTGHVCHSHEGHGGSMVFHFSNRETILFEFWTTNSTTSIVLSCLIVFIMAIGYEALKCYREWLKKCNKKRKDGGCDRNNAGQITPMQLPSPSTLIDAFSIPLSVVAPVATGAVAIAGASPNPNPNPNPNRNTNTLPRLMTRVPWLAPIHWYQTLLHMLQVTISFLLMLIFMTFNVWLCIAVVLGAGVGYFLFFAQSENVSDHCN